MKNEACRIYKDDVQWLLEHCHVCMVNCQNITHSSLQLIVAFDANERVQANLIKMRTKPDGFHLWIFHIKDHFLKHTMLYALISKKPPRLRIISAFTFVILGRLEFFSAIMVKSLELTC